jgi:hypothetical protein
LKQDRAKDTCKGIVSKLTIKCCMCQKCGKIIDYN